MDSTLIRYIKHYIKKLIGRPDPAWTMFSFEERVARKTYGQHDTILAWAEECLKNKNVFESEENYAASNDPIVRQGFSLKKKIEKEFKNKYSAHTTVRILIHVPDQYKSPAGYSLFTNFIEAFEFLGISVRAFNWHDDIQAAFQEFKPTVFLSSDHEVFLSRLDWGKISSYRKDHPLLIGLTAGLEEYGNTPLKERLVWAKKHAIDFYYSYRDRAYLETKKEYQPFYDAGYKIFPLMFGANILVYYPVPGIVRDIPYTFLASQNKSKAPRYTEYLTDIVSTYHGCIDGPGWRHIKNFSFMRDRDRYLYARTQVGLNIHLTEQIKYANEVNERVYMLAACGVPQVCDDAKLLHTLYSNEALWIANNGTEYKSYFDKILENPTEGQTRALRAQKETFENYTTFHRVETFLKRLIEEFPLVQS